MQCSPVQVREDQSRLARVGTPASPASGRHQVAHRFGRNPGRPLLGLLHPPGSHVLIRIACLVQASEQRVDTIVAQRPIAEELDDVRRGLQQLGTYRNEHLRIGGTGTPESRPQPLLLPDMWSQHASLYAGSSKRTKPPYSFISFAGTASRGPSSRRGCSLASRTHRESPSSTLRTNPD